MKVQTASGAVIDLGTTETSPTIGITDYSRRVTDDYGVTTVVERGFARRMSVRFALPSAQVDVVQRQLADLRAEPATWIADDRFASLSINGFYKDFSLDVPGSAINYCSLSVEGLAATEPFTDPGGDPAPAGQPSTLRLLQPIPIAGAMPVYSTVPENDAPLWSGSTTYAAGTRVIRGGERRIYESAIDGNLGQEPTLSPQAWIDVGPMSRWAMFDQALGTSTDSLGSMLVIVEPPVIAGTYAVALLDVDAATVTVEVHVAGQRAYQGIQTGGGTHTFLDLPHVGVSHSVVVIIEGATSSTPISVGTMLLGQVVALGVTEASPTAAITDYSRKEVDDFGEVTIVERAWSKRMTTAALIRTDAIDTVAGRIAAVRARPSLWIGSAQQDALTIYGFFKDFSIEVGESTAKLTLTIEGLSKAAPVEARPAGLVPAGTYDPATLYRSGDVVQHDGSSWLYINAVRARGHVPPTLPTEENAWWRVLARSGTDGRGGYTAVLANENHIVPADEAGNVLTYDGAGSSYQVLYGTADVSSAFALSVVANPQSLTVSIVGRTFAVTGGLDLGEPAGRVTVRATGSGVHAGVVIDKTFSLTKSRAGADGSSPVLVQLTALPSVIRYNALDQIASGPITFTSARQNTADLVSFRFEGFNGAGLAQGTAQQLVDGYSGTIFTSTGPDNVTITQAWAGAVVDGYGGGIVVRAFIGTYDIGDAVSLTKVKDGAKGESSLSGYLTNESHVVPCTAAGEPITFVGASGNFRVFNGLSEVTGSCTFAEVHNVDASIYNPDGGGGFYQADYLGADVGTVIIRATYAGTSIDKAFTLTKSRAAVDGTSPPLLSMSASALALRRNADGSEIAGQADFVFRAYPTNLAGPVIFSISPHSTGATGVTVSGDTMTITAHRMWEMVNYNEVTPGMEGASLKVIASAGGLSDTATVVGIRNGARGVPGLDAYNMVLTNEDVTVPATSAGDVISYAGTPTSILVLYGSQDVTGAFTSSVVSNPQALTIGGAHPSYTVTGGFDAGEDTATLTFQAIGTGAHASVALLKTMTLGKSRAAVDGTSPPLITLAATQNVIRYDKAGVIASGPITFTTVRQNTTNAPLFQIFGLDGTARSGVNTAAGHAASSPTLMSSSAPDSLTLTQSWLDDITATYGGVRVVAAVGDISDRIGLPKVKDGADGASAPIVRTQWSIDGSTGWHDSYFGADRYYRQSSDNGATWGPAILGVGESGLPGQDGASVSAVFVRSALVPATPTVNTGNPPTGWYDAPPDGADFLWLSKANFRGATQLTPWSTPQRISGADGVSAFVMVNITNMAVSADSTTKAAGGVGWNAKARTREGYVGAAMSGHLPDQGTFIGLTTDPDAGNYETIDYAAHVSEDGNFYLFRNGATFLYGGGGYGSVFAVVSDTRTVRYTINGYLLAEHPVNDSNETLYGVTACFREGQTVDRIAFAPNGRAGSDGTPGTPGPPGNPGTPGTNGGTQGGGTLVGIGSASGGGTVGPQAQAAVGPGTVRFHGSVTFSGTAVGGSLSLNAVTPRGVFTLLTVYSDDAGYQPDTQTYAADIETTVANNVPGGSLEPWTIQAVMQRSGGGSLAIQNNIAFQVV